VKEDKSDYHAFPIYRSLTLRQLDELRALDSSVLTQEIFVKLYLDRLQPSRDVDLTRNEEKMETYLERLYDFMLQLPQIFNSYKAVVFYNRLLLSQRKGEYDKNMFLEYIKLPRDVSYVYPSIRDEAREKKTLYILHFSRFFFNPS